MVKTKNSKDKDILLRQRKLQDVISNFHKHNVTPIKKQIIDAMIENGFTNYNRITLYRDETIVNRKNTFVRDITESNYSAMVEKQMRELEDIQDTVKTWSLNPPTHVRQVFTYDYDNPTRTATPRLESAVSDTISPIQIISLREQLAQAHLRILNGDIVNTSIAMITEEFKSMQDLIIKHNDDKQALEEAKMDAQLKLKDDSKNV